MEIISIILFCLIWQEAHKKFQKGIKWPQAKLEKQLFDALVNSLNAEQLKVLKTYAMGILAEYRFQDLSKELKVSENIF